VTTLNAASYVPSIRDMRAEPRLYLRMNLWVEWREHGETLSAQGYTVDISPKGCMAIVPQGLPVGQKLVVQNELNGKSVAATLIWQATTSVAVGLLIGIPAGIVLGRQLWILFAQDIDVVPAPSVPPSIALVAVGALLLAVVVAAIPGRIASTTPAAVVLRQE